MLRLDAPNGTAIAALTTTDTHTDLDAEAEFDIREVSTSAGETVAPAEIALVDAASPATSLVWRVEDQADNAGGRSHTRSLVMWMGVGVKGTTTWRQAAFSAETLGIGNKVNLRIVRAGARVWLLANGRVVHTDYFVDTDMSIRIGAFADTNSGARTRVSAYVRRPMVIFSKPSEPTPWPSLEYGTYDSTFINGTAPAVDQIGTYDVNVQAGPTDGVQIMLDRWTYTRRQDGPPHTQGTQSLAFLSDSIIKRPGRS